MRYSLGPESVGAEPKETEEEALVKERVSIVVRVRTRSRSERCITTYLDTNISDTEGVG